MVYRQRLKLHALNIFDTLAESAVTAEKVNRGAVTPIAISPTVLEGVQTSDTLQNPSSSWQVVPGTSETVNLATDSTLLVHVKARLRVQGGGASVAVQLAINGSRYTANADGLILVSQSDTQTVESLHLVVPLPAGEHTIELHATSTGSNTKYVYASGWHAIVIGGQA